MFAWLFFFQAEDGIRDLVRSRGLGDVYKRQASFDRTLRDGGVQVKRSPYRSPNTCAFVERFIQTCLLYTSDAADERSSVDLGGRRIIKKKNSTAVQGSLEIANQN